MPSARFGVSTLVYHDRRLSRQHLLEVAAQGFKTIELWALRSHFDYQNSAAIADLQQWLAEAGLTLNSVHAPIAESISAGRPHVPLTLASADASQRVRAVEEVERALLVARRIPFSALIVHLGSPRSGQSSAGDNSRDAARRSIEALHRTAEPLGVRLALEVIPNELSRAGSLVHFIEETIDAPSVGVCLDFGHAHLEGDVVDAIETVSEYLMAADLHDNRGRRDDHLLPLEGSIDWPAALTAVQKVGYDGTLMLETASHGSPKETLQRAARACQQMGRLLAR